ncbi:MAG: proteasome assembly chaperone family protein [Candidatus Altiarchaeales archaeon]|nr:proteasome assembly chaperone family protein [Candidatus Altiarchaeales archaeon]MBD3415765.1 proteasome assembly chaperone family protein [Candidatus Altiarchaeales archaeon]
MIERPELKKTILIEGLPGIGLVGKLAGDHLKDELKAVKFAELTSTYLPPQVSIQDDGTVKLVNMEMYYWKGKENDIILLLGDFQGLTPESQYYIADRILDFGKDYDLRRLYTLGGLGTGAITHTPRVFGAATSKNLVSELEEYGIVFKGGGAIFGASGLLLGLSIPRKIEAVCLMGETHGQIIDAKSAEAVLQILTKILGVEVNMNELKKKARQTEDQINKMSQMIDTHRKSVERQQELLDENPFYIR